jgi:hypothetical protein
MVTPRSIVVVMAVVMAAAGLILAAAAHARGGADAVPRPIIAAYRHSATERDWQRLAAENEQPLREIISASDPAKEALASLDASVLSPHHWTLTQFMVRTLSELHAKSIWEARVQLGNEDYTRQALHDADWDGSNAWEVMEGVRGETLQILVWLEKVRTGGSEQAEQTQMLVARLLDAASRSESNPAARLPRRSV